MKFKDLKKIMSEYKTIEVHYTDSNGRYDYLPCYTPGLDGHRHDDDKVLFIDCNAEQRLLTVHLKGTKN